MNQEKDFIAMACTTASVSYREVLVPAELVNALSSGQVPPNRAAHLLTLMEEAPENLLLGLLAQVGKSLGRLRVEENFLRIADKLGVSNRARRILDSDPDKSTPG